MGEVIVRSALKFEAVDIPKTMTEYSFPATPPSSSTRDRHTQTPLKMIPANFCLLHYPTTTTTNTTNMARGGMANLLEWYLREGKVRGASTPPPFVCLL